MQFADMVQLYKFWCLRWFHLVILCGNIYNLVKGQTCPCESCNWDTQFVTEGTITKENVALGKIAWMSSQWPNSGPACFAVDGKTDRSYGRYPNYNCISTADVDKNPFWLVDLGSTFSVKYLTVYTMQGYIDQMKGVKITVDDQGCYNFSETTAIQELENITCVKEILGKTIKFTSLRNAYLAFCEVQVWNQPSSCVKTQTCNWKNKCAHGGNCLKENVALGKLASMSTRWGNSGEAYLAVDGTTNRTYQHNPNPNCISTAEIGENPFWKVDLGQTFIIKHITVYTMDRYKDQMHNVTITVDGKECYTFEAWETIEDEVHVKCETAVAGQVVKFASTTNSYLSFCEVMVWACINRTYGDECSHSCGHCSDNAPCDIDNGTCVSCEPGFIPPLCQTPCNEGSYGDNCSSLCGTCTGNASCDAVTGLCISCEPGYSLPFCQSPCSKNTYGQNCSLLCGHCPGDVPCDPVNGMCASCEPGYLPPLCQSPDNREGQVCSNAGAIAGAVAGGCVSVSIVIAITIFCFRRKGQDPKGPREPSVVFQSQSGTTPVISTSEAKSPSQYEDVGNSYDHVQSPTPIEYTMLVNNSQSTENEHKRTNTLEQGKEYYNVNSS